MTVRQAIEKQLKEIENLQDDVNWLLKLGDTQKAITKQQRADLLVRQINIVKEKFLC